MFLYPGFGNIDFRNDLSSVKYANGLPRCSDVVLSSLPIQILLASGNSPSIQNLVEEEGTEALSGPVKVGYVFLQGLEFA
jgi:hypothetical protein